MDTVPYIEFEEGDCYECLKRVAPDFFNLVLMDPPYGYTQAAWV